MSKYFTFKILYRFSIILTALSFLNLLGCYALSKRGEKEEILLREQPQLSYETSNRGKEPFGCISQ